MLGGSDHTVGEALHAQSSPAVEEVLAQLERLVASPDLEVPERARRFLLTESSQTTIIGMFAPNGFQTIRPAARVMLVLDNDPGRLHEGRITDIPRGIDQVQVATSGMLARTSAIGGANAYPATTSLPHGVDPEFLRLGMPGQATVFAEDASVIGSIA